VKQQPTRRQSASEADEARRQYRQVLRHWVGDYLRWRAGQRWPLVDPVDRKGDHRVNGRTVPDRGRFTALYTGSVLDD